MLRQPFHSFLKEQLLLPGERGIRIHLRLQIAVTLQQPGRDRAELDIRLQSQIDRGVVQLSISYDLPVIGTVFGHPSLEFNQ